MVDFFAVAFEIRPRRWPNNGAGFLLAQATGSRL
jgi:hypothetical protein|nr:MAG TPA: hypothetical protein [Caudoviricetes sp.]